MSSANVRSIQALEDLRSALTTFNGSAQDALRSATIEVQRTLEFLAERERYWRGRVTTAEAEVQRAIAAFNTCRSRVSRDSEGRVYQPPCDAEMAAVQRARDDLANAQTQLQNAHAWFGRVEQAAAAFQQQTQRMNTTLSDLPKATAMLSNKVDTLKGYAAMSAPSGGGGGFVGGGGASGGAMGAFGGVTGAAASSGFTPGYMQTVLSGLANGTASFASLANMVQRGVNVAANGDPVLNLPLRYVPLSQIDVSDSSIRSAADFDNTSPAEMQVWFDKLQRVVAPGLAQGATGDDFQRLDGALGLDYSNGYQCVYEIFYGGDSIKLTPIAGGRYRVTDGYHRLYLAQQLGLPGIPANIFDRP